MAQDGQMDIRTADSRSTVTPQHQIKCPNCGEMVTPTVIVRQGGSGSGVSGDVKERRKACCSCPKKLKQVKVQRLSERPDDNDLLVSASVMSVRKLTEPDDLRSLVQLCPNCHNEITEVFY